MDVIWQEYHRIGSKRETIANVDPCSVEDGASGFAGEDLHAVIRYNSEEERTPSNFWPAIFGHENIV